MEEKIHHLINERNPWLLKSNFFSKIVYKMLKKYLKFNETVFVGEHIQSMSGQEAFSWLVMSIQVTALLKVLKIFLVMENS